MNKNQYYILHIMAFIGLSFLMTCQTNPEHSKPNIILILADDLGYADLGCYGQTSFSTPHIDKLAKEGMKFTQHYAGSTVCAPSRCVLMTGKHTGHSFVRGNAQNTLANGQIPLPVEESTFVAQLKTLGYRTGAFGKWGLGNAGTIGDPLIHGFDEFFGYHDQVLAHNSYPEFLYKNEEKIYLDNEVNYLSDTLWHKGLGSISTKKLTYSNDLILEEALKFINKNKGVPFFLYFPTTIPHDNGEAEIGNRFEVPDNSKYQNKNWTKDEKSYAALVEHLDAHVGKLTMELDHLDLAENTIIIFTSDNGPLPSDQLNSNGDLRGHKRDLYEGGIRVPLIIKWPDKIKANSHSDHVSAFWDFYPTVLDIAGLDDYHKTDGISFLPELLGEEQAKHDYLYWEFHWWLPSRQAVRMGNWKGVKDTPASALELYHLKNDLSEKTNLATEYPAIVERIEQILIEARSKSQHFEIRP